MAEPLTEDQQLLVRAVAEHHRACGRTGMGEIADSTGYSRSTVSLAANGKPVREMVRAAILMHCHVAAVHLPGYGDVDLLDADMQERAAHAIHRLGLSAERATLLRDYVRVIIEREAGQTSTTSRM